MIKHKVKLKVETEKKGLFGKKKVTEEKTVWVDEKTYRELKRGKKDDEYSVFEMMLYDDWLDD